MTATTTTTVAKPARRVAPVRGLVASVAVSQAGTAMSAVAIPWLVLALTGSAGRTGLAGFTELLPYVLAQATSGPVADRVGWRRTCVSGNAAAATAVCALPLLSALDDLGFAALLVLVALAGLARGVADAATTPLVPGTAALAGMSNERVAGWYSGATRTGLLVGAPLAGALIGATGPATVVLIDGISFALAAVGIAACVPTSVQDAARAETAPTRWSLRGYGRDLADGFRFLRRARLLLGIAILAATTNLLDEALFTVLLPIWSRDRLHEATGVGLVSGAVGVGTLAGVLVGAWLGERLPRYRTFSIGFLIGGSPMFFVLAAVSTMPLAVAVATFSGFFAGFLNPIIGALNYERVPPQMQARVLGAVRASAWLGLPIGALLGGAVTELIGLTGALVAAGFGMLLVTAMPTLRPRIWRTMERGAADVAGPAHG